MLFCTLKTQLYCIMIISVTDNQINAKKVSSLAVVLVSSSKICFFWQSLPAVKWSRWFLSEVLNSEGSPTSQIITVMRAAFGPHTCCGPLSSRCCGVDFYECVTAIKLYHVMGFFSPFSRVYFFLWDLIRGVSLYLQSVWELPYAAACMSPSSSDADGGCSNATRLARIKETWLADTPFLLLFPTLSLLFS